MSGDQVNGICCKFDGGYYKIDVGGMQNLYTSWHYMLSHIITYEYNFQEYVFNKKYQGQDILQKFEGGSERNNSFDDCSTGTYLLEIYSLLIFLYPFNYMISF